MKRYRNHHGRRGRSWSQICDATNRQMHSFCVVDPRHGGSIHVHHVRYKRFFWYCFKTKPVGGLERPGVDVYPVCTYCHGKLHQSTSKRLWVEFPPIEVEGKSNPSPRNHNRFWVRQRLRLRWLFWTTLFTLCPVLPWMLRHPYISLAGLVVVLVLALGSITWVTTQCDRCQVWSDRIVQKIK